MITVVIPAYNEEGAISQTVKDITYVLINSGYKESEIIVVDDGSTDKTAQLAIEAGASVISKIQNLGYGHSLKLGILAAKFDTIVITDADGTYPVNEIPSLITLYNSGYDLVIGARTGKYFRESLIKSPLRKVLKFLVEFAAGRKIDDPNSGLRVFSKKQILPIFPTLCDRFSFTTSMTLAFMMLQKSVMFSKIDYSKRIGKTKVKLFKDSLITLQYIVQAINYYNPIKIFLVLFFAAGFISFLSLVLGIYLKIKTFVLLGTGGFIASMIILALGLIADLLKQLIVSNKE